MKKSSKKMNYTGPKVSPTWFKASGVKIGTDKIGEHFGGVGSGMGTSSHAVPGRKATRTK